MSVEKKWEESVRKTFRPNFPKVEYIKEASKVKYQIEFDISLTAPYNIIKKTFSDLTNEDIDLFINDAKSKKESKVIIFATCECFLVCDEKGNCHRECYICYPPPAAKCCCPGVCG